MNRLGLNIKKLFFMVFEFYDLRVGKKEKISKYQKIQIFEHNGCKLLHVKEFLHAWMRLEY